MLPRPAHRHEGPIADLGRLVVDLVLAGWRITYAGPEPIQVEVSGGGVTALTNCWRFRVVCTAPSAWTVEEVDQFDWIGADRALTALRARVLVRLPA